VHGDVPLDTEIERARKREERVRQERPEDWISENTLNKTPKQEVADL
jgi:hypothetical protein